MQEALLKRDGFFDFSLWPILKLSGPDARDYLNRMSSVKVQAGKVFPGAFLNGKGQVVSLGYFWEEAKDFYYLTQPSQRDIAFDHIEKFHFGEAFELEVLPQTAVLGLYGEKTALSLGLAVPDEPYLLSQSTLAGKPAWVWRDGRIAHLLYLIVDTAQATQVKEKLGSQQLPPELFRRLRIESGLPQVGEEITGNEIILEAGLDDFVQRNKGCYPGQEVVERIFTYGQVNKKLMKVELDLSSEIVPKLPLSLKDEDKVVGNLVSVSLTPESSGRAVGLAYIQSKYWNTDKHFTPETGITVRLAQ